MADKSTILTIQSDLPPERVAGLTRDLARDLSRGRIQVAEQKAATAPGERGDAISLGQIALALVTTGAVGILFDCLRVYLKREKRLVFEVKQSNGVSFKIDAKSIDDPLLERTIIEAVGFKGK